MTLLLSSLLLFSTICDTPGLTVGFKFIDRPRMWLLTAPIPHFLRSEPVGLPLDFIRYFQGGAVIPVFVFLRFEPLALRQSSFSFCTPCDVAYVTMTDSSDVGH